MSGEGHLELRAVSQRSSANVSEVGSQFYRQLTAGNMSVVSAAEQGSVRNAPSTFHPDTRPLPQHSTGSEMTAGDALESGNMVFAKRMTRELYKQSSIETEAFDPSQPSNRIDDSVSRELDVSAPPLYTQEERDLMAQSTPFVANYFSSRPGQRFLKENP